MLVPGITGIDHVIIAVQDLPSAAALFAGVLGFHAGGGGIHPQFGTANRIIVVGDEYIELLAAQPGERPRGLVGGVLDGGEGNLACILAVADPAAFATEARARGLDVAGPAAGKLDAAGGFSRGWQTVMLPPGALPGVPFVIRHDTAGDERRRLLAGPQGLAPHANAARRVAAVTMAVKDCRASWSAVRDLIGVEACMDGRDRMLAADTITLTLQSGATIVLASPVEPGAGPVAALLAQRGESALSVTIAVDGLPGVVAMLRGRGVGVRVEEPGGVLVAAQLNQRHTLGARIGLIGA